VESASSSQPVTIADRITQEANAVLHAVKQPKP
jgi:hypothetical protein